jgi:hypothetical protein
MRSISQRHQRVQWLVRASLLMLILLGHAQWPATTAAEAQLKVKVYPRFLNAGGDARVLVRVEPDDNNRILHVVLDGSYYYASTDVQLDGATAARTHELWWRTLPAGEYMVWVTVERASGHELMDHMSMTVVGDAGEAHDE